MAVNTARLMRELQAQGMPEGQDTLISDTFHDLQDAQVTREYLHAELSTIRAELRQEMAQLRTEFEASQRRMMMWLTPILAAQVGTIAGIVGLLLK
jgi:hypothetical protein